jgi:single-strand DNA-binding protein
MSNVNKVMLLGRLTHDPEMRRTNSGTEVTDFSLATKRVWKNQNGDTQEETTFVDAVAWGRQADLIASRFSKGQRIFIEGRLKLEKWETDGEKRSKLRVHVENFQFIERKGEGAAVTTGAGSESDDDAPF